MLKNLVFHAFICHSSPSIPHISNHIYKLSHAALCAVDARWLPRLATFHTRLSAPLTEPPPRYSPEQDAVLCDRTGTFGPRRWPLPGEATRGMTHPDAGVRVRVFAAAFLEGSVCPNMRTFVPHLLCPPAVLTKSWARCPPDSLYHSNTYLRYLSEISFTMYNSCRCFSHPLHAHSYTTQKYRNGV